MFIHIRTKTVSLWVFLIAFFTQFFVRKLPAKISKPRKAKQQYEDVPGQYHTIGALLGDLDNVFKILKKLEPRKSHIQAMIKRYGPFIPDFRSYDPNDRIIASHSLDGFAAYGLPSHMIMYWPKAQVKLFEDNPDYPDEEYMEQYFCATKAKRISGLAITKGCVVYETNLVCLLKNKPYELCYYIEVNKETGEFRGIKVPYKRTHRIPHKNNRKRDGRVSHFSTTTWEYPDMVSDEEYHSDAARKETMETKFALAYNITMLREYGVNIIIKKGNRRITMSVPQDRWKYFFKDRIKVKTLQGNTKPIFHSVMAHARHLKNKVTAVSTHYRGTRHFYWKGYEIQIVMQGKHGKAQASLDLQAECFRSDELPKEGYVDITKPNIAKDINATFEGEN